MTNVDELRAALRHVEAAEASLARTFECLIKVGDHVRVLSASMRLIRRVRKRLKTEIDRLQDSKG